MLKNLALWTLVAATGAGAPGDVELSDRREVPASDASVVYEGQLDRHGSPVEGVVQVKACVLSSGEVVWSNDGSSRTGEEPVAATPVVVEQGKLAFPLPGLGPSRLSGDAVLRLWVSIDGSSFEAMGDVDISSSAPLGGNAAPVPRAGSGDTLQDAYDNSVALTGFAIVDTQSGKPVTFRAQLGSIQPALKVTSGAPGGWGAGLQGFVSVGPASIAPPAPLTVVPEDTGTNAVPGGWGTGLAVKRDGLEHGAALDVEFLTGTTRLTLRGSSSPAPGNERFVIWSEERSDVESVVVDNATVGVGLLPGTAPGAELHVRGTQGSGHAEMRLESESGKGIGLRTDDAGNFSIFDHTAAANRVHIGTEGKVGIGTASPSGDLTVRSRNVLTTEGRITLEAFDGDSWDIVATDNENFVLRSGGVDELLIDPDAGRATFSGRVVAETLELTGGADFAEPFPVEGSGVDAGTVVVIDADRPGAVRASHVEYDTGVIGVVSGGGGLEPGVVLNGLEFDGGVNVALTGRVYVKADASAGPIRPGDLLTTSSTPGHAQRAVDVSRSHGAVLGKALTGLDNGHGHVLMLVAMQ